MRLISILFLLCAGCQSSPMPCLADDDVDHLTTSWLLALEAKQSGEAGRVWGEIMEANYAIELADGN